MGALDARQTSGASEGNYYANNFHTQSLIFQILLTLVSIHFYRLSDKQLRNYTETHPNKKRSL